MKEQLDLFSGENLRDQGIKKATDNANHHTNGWSQKAYDFLLAYIAVSSEEFMTEDVRIASKGIVPEPPSKRAWGGVIVRAAREGKVVQLGFKKVTNATAHCTPASVWVKK
jgi:hypothetical protein